MHISFIIPCYGSEKTIEFVVTELIAKMSEKPDIDYEIIAVNDCSPDAVWSVLNHLSEQHDCLKLIDLAKNMNRPGAVMAGLRMSSGDIAVIMDDDGQCPVSELWQLLEPLQHDFDVSMAKYPQRKQTWFKSFGTWVNRKMTEFIIKKPKNLEFTNFMAIKRYVVDEMIRYDNPYPYLTGLLLRTTKHITKCGNGATQSLHRRLFFHFSENVQPLEQWAYRIFSSTASGGFRVGILLCNGRISLRDMEDYPETVAPIYSCRLQLDRCFYPDHWWYYHDDAGTDW
jgi:hypothetical protein